MRLSHGVPQRPALLRHLRSAPARLPRFHANRVRGRGHGVAAKDRLEGRAGVPAQAARPQPQRQAPLTLAALAVTAALYQGMHWRFVGPLRGGRTVAIDGVGARTESLLHRRGSTAAFGRVKMRAVPGSLSSIENQPVRSSARGGAKRSTDHLCGQRGGLQRPDLAVGNGIYKSGDGGDTWTHPRSARRASRSPRLPSIRGTQTGCSSACSAIRTAPMRNAASIAPSTAAQRSRKFSIRTRNVGAFDVVIDPNDPNVVYATLWAARQAPWEIGASFEMPGSGSSSRATVARAGRS